MSVKPDASLRGRLADFLFGGVIEARVQSALKVMDDAYWSPLSGQPAPLDLKWSDRQHDLKDALEAWRNNPLARQIVRLTRGFVLQDGIVYRARTTRLQKFVDAFWYHEMNRMPRRLRQWCDSLTLSGEVFAVLFTNEADGMSYVRSLPAARIDRIETKEGDYESEEAYHELGRGNPEGRIWHGKASPFYDPRRPEMLHFAVNRQEGSTRGSGDLDGVLPWMERYKNWLIDRAVLNEAKTRVVWDLTVQGGDDKALRRAKSELMNLMTGAGGIYAHNEKEALNPKYPGIGADAAEPDGRALRLMVASGVGIALHHFGEADTANRASSQSSDRAMVSHYAARQRELIDFGHELIERAAYRAKVIGRLAIPQAGLGLRAEVQELTKEDNLQLAQAAQAIVNALTSAKREGWIGDEAARYLLYKFAGENVPDAPTMGGDE